MTFGIQGSPLALERRLRVLLLTVCGDQRRVQIDDQRLIRRCRGIWCVVGGQRPNHRARMQTGLVDRGQHPVRIGGQSSDRARHCRVRRHRPVDARLRTHGREVAERAPPRVRAIARSSMIFPGSCVASGLRHRANWPDNDQSRPDARIVSVNKIPPACPAVAISAVSA